VEGITQLGMNGGKVPTVRTLFTGPREDPLYGRERKLRPEGDLGLQSKVTRKLIRGRGEGKVEDQPIIIGSERLRMKARARWEETRMQYKTDLSPRSGGDPEGQGKTNYYS